MPITILKKIPVLAWRYNVANLDARYLLKASNLSDLASASTARTNLGVGTGDSPTFVSLTLTGTVETNGFIGATVAKSGAYTATATDYAIICDATSAAFTITLPAAASHTGRVYHIKKIDATGNAVTVDGNSSETIDDATTATLASQYDAVTIQSDGSEWWIL